MIQFFRDLLQTGANTDGEVSDHELRIAAALLLIEVAHADHAWEQSEIDTIIDRITKLFSLDESTAQALYEEARQKDEASTSLQPTLRLINDHFSPEQKFEMLTDLWRVAFADGSLDHHEEHQIRRIAELLYLPHSQFIQAKLRAEAELDEIEHASQEES